MLFTAGEIDFMLKGTGESVAFLRGTVLLGTTRGILESKQIVVPTQEGGLRAGLNDITLLVRDGTHGTATVGDTARVTVVDRSGLQRSITDYRIDDLGIAMADGMRRLTLAGG